jgi:hypothetical protein
MPTRESSAKRLLRKSYLQRLDWAAAHIPKNAQHRLTETSTLSECLQTRCRYNFGAYQFDECGQPIKIQKPGSANLDRHIQTVMKAKLLREKYGSIWNTRCAAGIISRLEKLPADSVRRYKRMLINIE